MSQKNKNWQPHNPERFENYTLLEDKKGFKLPDGKIFKFDKNGGWTDEFGNRYNSNGEPIDSDFDYDEYDDDFGYDDYEDDFFAYENDDGMQDFDVKDDEYKIIELLANLDSFPEEKEIIIEFNNLEFKARENDVAEFFLGNHQPYKLLQNQVFVKNKLLFTIEIDKYLDEEKNRYLKNGKGRIITDDRKFAKLCAELHGSKLLNRSLYLSIPSYCKDSDLDDFETKVLPNHNISGATNVKDATQKTDENKEPGKKMNANSTAFNLSTQKEQNQKTVQKAEPTNIENKIAPKQEQENQKNLAKPEIKNTEKIGVSAAVQEKKEEHTKEAKPQKIENVTEEKKVEVEEPAKKVVPVESDYDPADPWSKPILKISSKPATNPATQPTSKKPSSTSTSKSQNQNAKTTSTAKNSGNKGGVSNQKNK